MGCQSIADYCQARYNNYKDKFSHCGIRYILANEKYIGDSLYQKNYNDNVVPFRERINRGEKQKYYIECTHEGVIPKYQFDVVQQMLNNYESKPIKKNSIFNKRIVCYCCSSFYKLKVNNGVFCWVCRKHDTHAGDCKSGIVAEEKIENAFISLFNKLYSDYSELLLPIKQALQELEVKRAVGNNSIIELRRDILQLKEQLKVIATLHTKGFLNEAKFKEQSLEINNKIDKLSKDIRLLSQSDDTELKQIEILIDYFEKREHIMIEFEPQAFEFLIDKIVVKDNILEFHIKGGLVFTEEI